MKRARVSNLMVNETTSIIRQLDSAFENNMQRVDELATGLTYNSNTGNYSGPKGYDVKAGYNEYQTANMETFRPIVYLNKFDDIGIYPEICVRLINISKNDFNNNNEFSLFVGDRENGIKIDFDKITQKETLKICSGADINIKQMIFEYKLGNLY